jgi:hypothetical protein
MTEAEALALATHRHYKGGLYRVIGVARHSETEEPMIVYEHLWPHDHGLWVRPAELFNGTLADGSPRFKALDIPCKGCVALQAITLFQAAVKPL